jgi:hypothetical protein
MYVVLGAALLAAPVMAQNGKPADIARCLRIEVSKPVNFHGQMLVEIPDIREPDLRLANQLLSSDCFERAEQVFTGFVRRHPGNLHATYYLARRAWLTHSAERARDILETTLAWAPDFTSAKVLLASLDLSENNPGRALQLLKEAERVSPEDVWVFINRSQLASGGQPTPELRSRLLEIARNEAFPPNVRVYAADISKRVTLSKGDFEESQRAAASVRSPMTACEMANLAMHLGEGEGRFAEVRELLESPAAQSSNCLDLELNRVLLAQAYLMEAAAISPRPDSRNFHLVAKANQIMGDDYMELVNWVAGRPQAAKLQPFLRTTAHPDEKDKHGRTAICHALDQRDARLVRAHLDDGANPRGECHGMPLMHRLTYMADGTRASDIQAIAKALLDYGAPPVIEPCKSNENSRYCSRDLLPTLLRGRD